MKIHIVQHVPFEKPGLISKWIEKHDHSLEMIEVFNGDSFPKVEDVSFLIVLGGPMSANDSDNWLKEESELIKAVVDQNKAMLGICLGAQLLAKVYGSQIVATPKEVGWGNVTSLTQEFHSDQQSVVLHWHGEGFTLPHSSTLLYSTKNWTNQGFRIKNAVGLQFHFEATTETLNDIIEADSKFLEDSIFSVTSEDTKEFPVPLVNKAILFSILDRLENEIH